MSKSKKSQTFIYVDEFTNETVTMDKYFYTQPERDFEGEKRSRDLRTILISFVSDPEYLEDTYNFFLTRNCAANSFIREFDMIKLKKQKKLKLKEDYNYAKKMLEDTDHSKLKEYLKKDKSDLSNRERKIINGYYRSKFMVQRLEYYDRYIMDGTIGLNA